MAISDHGKDDKKKQRELQPLPAIAGRIPMFSLY
jgi:hypothetical protein